MTDKKKQTKKKTKAQQRLEAAEAYTERSLKRAKSHQESVRTRAKMLKEQAKKKKAKK